MENKNLSKQLKENNANLKKLDNKEKELKDFFLKDSRSTYDYYEEKINKIKDLKNKKLSEIKELEHIEIQKIKNKQNPLYEINKDIIEKFKLFTIKENLNEEIEIKYDGFNRDNIENIKSENLNLIKIGAFTSDNRYKPVNKFELKIELIYKHPKVENFIKTPGYGKTIFEKSFKTLDESKAYLIKNYDKLTAEYKKMDLELSEELKEVDINLTNEFDFSTIRKRHSSQWDVEIKSKTEIILKERYDQKIEVKVSYIGDKKFEIDKKEGKEELDYLIKYSYYDFSPEIIIS